MITLSEYQEAMTSTLEYWLNIHTQAEAWAEYWIGEDTNYTFTSNSGRLSNEYFNFNWTASALKMWVKENRHLFKVCSCGIFERGYEDCEHVGRNPTIADLTEYMQDINCEVEIANLVGDYILEQSLIQDGFKVYRKALKPLTHCVEVEIKDVLRQINRATNDDDLLAALAWANHVNHVNGSIARDYGEQFDLDYKLIDRISQEGIGNVFQLEEQ